MKKKLPFQRPCDITKPYKFRSHFLSEISQAIDLKAEMTSRRHFNCKAVEVTKVIEKVRVRRNKNLLDEVQKHSRTSSD